MAKTEKTPIQDETLKSYLNAMGRVPLLSHAQEIECGKSIEKGGPEGQKALNLLVRSNLRLVVLLAKKLQRPGFTLPDMIQDGNLGLMRAAEKYDYRRGFRFSTYASWWIKQSILRSGEQQGRMIRMPSSRMAQMHQVFQAQRLLSHKNGVEPSCQEIADFLNLELELVESLMFLSQDVMSLDEPLGDEAQSKLIDFVEDDALVSIVDILEHEATGVELDDLLSELLPREEKVIRLRYGFGEPRILSLEEIGYRFRLTRERIRQIEIKGLTSLRRLWRTKKFT